MIQNRDVIFVSNSLAKGGAARVICVLASEFVQQGLNVGIAAYAQHDGEYELPLDVVKEYGPSISKVKRILWLRDLIKRNPKATIIAFEYFVNMQTVVACVGLPNKLIISERNDPSRVGNTPRTNWLRERLYRHADMLVCQTDDAAAYFSDKVNKCVILNPIKEDLPEPYRGERRHAVVAFCRLEKQKNLDMLVYAFDEFVKSHDDYTLEIYGDGSEREHLEQLVHTLNLEEKVSINHGRSDIHQVVRDAAMFVLPSNYEGLSNSMLEAMAIGLPVICTDCPCGGARMVIKNGVNGILVPVKDVGALAKAMTDMVDKLDAREIGNRASNLLQSLSPVIIAKQWKRLF